MESARNCMKENVKLILFVFFLLIVFIALYFSFSVLMISLIGVGIGVLVDPILSLFKRKFSMPRGLSALLFFLFIILCIGGVLYAVQYLVSEQIASLVERAPQIAKDLNQQISSFLKRHPLLGDLWNRLSITSTSENTVAQTFKGLRMGLEAMAGLGFAIILGLYTAISLPKYFKATITMFPAGRRERAENILHKCASTLRMWFSAQATDMAIVGAITTLSLWAIGVEFWAVYGLMTAVFTIVPYVGILLVVVCAGLITLASDPSMVIWVLVVFAVTQQIEANVILPIIMKSQVDLPKVPLLVFILFFGVWFGLLGVFLAPPLFAILRLLYLEIYLPKMNQS